MTSHVTQTEAAASRCELCGEEAATQVTKEQAFTYAGGSSEVTLTAKVPVWSCLACGEEYVDERGEEAQHDAVCHHLGRLTPSELRGLRARYRMSQDDLARATSIGIASIKRWESASLIQNEAMDKYIRLIAKSDTLASFSPDFSAEPVFRTEMTSSQKDRALRFRLRPSSQCGEATST